MPEKALDRDKVPVGKILEAASTLGKGFISGLEGFNDRKKMFVIITQFEFYGTNPRWISCDSSRCLERVAVIFNQRLKAKALQSLRDGAAVPT